MVAQLAWFYFQSVLILFNAATHFFAGHANITAQEHASITAHEHALALHVLSMYVLGATRTDGELSS